jgi:hypothetical protein
MLSRRLGHREQLSKACCCASYRAGPALSEESRGLHKIRLAINPACLDGVQLTRSPTSRRLPRRLTKGNVNRQDRASHCWSAKPKESVRDHLGLAQLTHARGGARCRIVGVI